jgi:RND family efflux transporter MFP subunit
MMNSTKSLIGDLRIEKKSRRTKRSSPILFVLFLILAGAGAFVWWRTQIWAPEVRTVIATAADPGPKTVLNASGYIVARHVATCGSKVTGKVQDLLAEEGRRVKVGDVLARLDDSDTVASLDLAKAQLVAARDGIEQIKVQSDLAERTLVRETLLIKTKVETDLGFDQAKASAAALRAQLKLQEAQIIVAERQVTVMEAAEADMTIRAPFSGVITTKEAQPGEVISPVVTGGGPGSNRTGICTIVDEDSLEIEVEVNEDHLNKVMPGQPVTATLDAYPNWPIQGTVFALIPTADRNKGTVKVRIKFKNRDERILNQMEVRAAFLEPNQSAPRRQGVLVPRTALQEKGGDQFVWIVKDGHAQRRTIRAADYVGDQVLVSTGLNGGEAVVVDNHADLSAGERIHEAKP